MKSNGISTASPYTFLMHLTKIMPYESSTTKRTDILTKMYRL
ncbi:hypothetical protein NBRC111894_296 [Sporolactobacillus inulinus]|uniref:Uncharacterized protein n=1 Tax=Sporolactobacillus inulinus TaxID=2078 RepID=A0A4Y1Z6S3_9BACL|nr:hypothetical protein NBRC111894_296 [Sporolactobacillus inulinus]